MTYYCIGILRSGYHFYLSHVAPSKPDQKWTCYRSLDLATRFPSRESAIAGMREYVGNNYVGPVFVIETKFLKMPQTAEAV